MGLFSTKKPKRTLDDIVSVILLEQTQLYQQKSNWGFSLGGNSDGRVIAMDGGQVPAGSILTFSVTFRDGSKEIVKERSGTAKCDRLLQIAMDPSTAPANSNAASEKEYVPFSLEKNQLPNGDYLIGRDIPAGTYDFTWVFGNGMILKFINDHDTTLGATTYFQHMGNKEDYEFRQCLNVKCEQGELLKIKGNIVVQISRSKAIKIDV